MTMMTMTTTATTTAGLQREATVGSKQPKTDAAESTLSTGRARGTVQHVYPERGFGFIRCTEGVTGDVGKDFFFHTTGLEDVVTLNELLPGTVVEFEPRVVPRGKRAERVVLAR
jgi:cold shock CspA family protein